MPVPPLNEHGLLPPGVHDCTLDEIKQTFAQPGANTRREELWSKLVSFLDWISSFVVFKRVYIDGGFVTNKESPKDIDIVFEMPFPSSQVLYRMDQRVFDRDYVDREFKLDVYFWWPGVPTPPHDLRLFFQYLKPEEIARRGLNPAQKKGILCVEL